MNDERSSNANAPAGDDWLDRLLGDDARATRDAYVADEGFTARVLSTLPAPVTEPAWRKPVVVALWGVAAVGCAIAMPAAMLDVGREAYRLLVAHPVSLSGIVGAAAAMFGLTAAAAAYSLRASD